MQKIKEQVRKKNLKTNKNENTTFQNLWNIVKTVLKGKFIAIQAFLKKQEKYQVNNLSYHLKELEKKEHKAQSQQNEGNNKDQRGNK